MQTGSASPIVEVTLALARADFHAAPLDLQTQARADRFRSAARRQTFINSRWLLGQHGSSITSSMAHCGFDAVVASTRAQIRLGVDIERVRDRDVLRIARFSFAEQEAVELEQLAGLERLRHFYSLWVLKEACAKASRRPLLEALAAFRFDTALIGTDRLLRTALLEPTPGLFVGLAVDAPAVLLRYQKWPGGEESAWPVRATDAVIE